MTTSQLLTRNYKEISDQVTALLQEHREFLIEKGIIRKVAPVTTEVWHRLWNKFISHTDPRVWKMGKDLKPLFIEQGAEVIDNIQRHPLPSSGKALTHTQERFIDSWMFDKKKWVKEFQNVEASHIAESLVSGGVATMELLPGTLDFDPKDIGVISFTQEQALRSSLEINEGSAKSLKGHLIAGVAAGEAIKGLTERVAVSTAFNVKVRSRRIAQTEVIGAVNKGSLEASKQSGVVWGHQWLAALDDLVRESHEELTMMGEAVKLGDQFSIGCEYPGDQGGPAAEVVNCRCTLLPLTEKP